MDDEILVERLTLLRNEVAYLKQERDALTSYREYEGNARLKRAVERSLQVSIEACLDIGRRIISEKGFRYPEDNKDVFQVLAEQGILFQSLLPALLNMARFRNLVVHDYARIDDVQVYAILTQRLADLDAFAKAIVAYLEGEEKSQ